jgi:ElaB/YqjD/DUF883 family membrane-anchored ribosome-binding protein
MAGPTNELTMPTRPIREIERDATPQIALQSDDPVVIRSQIERTRAQMGHTIDEIQQRLSPDRIKQETQDAIREATLGKVEKMAQSAERKVSNWRSSLMHTVRENPVPAALVGIGVGWMLLSDSGKSEQMKRQYDGRSYSGYSGYDSPNRGARSYSTDEYGRRHYYYDTDQDSNPVEQVQEWAGEKVDQVQAKASETMDQMRHRTAETTDQLRHRTAETTDQLRNRAVETSEQVQERALALQEQAQQQIHQARRTFWETLDTNPLAIGVAALAVGAVVGLALPGTSKEDEWMGETRDHLMEEAKNTAQETARKVQSVAERVQQTVKEEAQEAADEEGLLPQNKRETGQTGAGDVFTTTTGRTYTE